MKSEVRAVDEFGVIRYRGTEFALGWEMARRRVLVQARESSGLLVQTPAGEQVAVAMGWTRRMERRLRAEGVR